MFSSRFSEVIVISKNLYKVSGDVAVQGIASCEGLCYSLTRMKQIKFDVYSRKYFFIFVPTWQQSSTQTSSTIFPSTKFRFFRSIRRSSTSLKAADLVDFHATTSPISFNETNNCLTWVTNLTSVSLTNPTLRLTLKV